ncbi:hypothetical protein B0A50_05349 [Salinomyces thailandicus]|uniref:Uncharacterized protein n=1 Tax=Salinomyces thailandicus TaxID=706561 RepID=A0A4U0TWW0_9PEZI|nr:hypothetical protein B0A50_05349 [Salinomyces thailandica]
MVITRSPLEQIGMNGAGMQKRRSARLSHEGVGEDEPPAKKSRVNGATTKTISTKEQDGDASAAAKRKPRKQYEHNVDGFTFTKASKKGQTAKEPAVRDSTSDMTKVPGGNTSAPPNRKSRRQYEHDIDGFTFTKASKKGQTAKEPAVRNSSSARPATPPAAGENVRIQASDEDVAPLKTGQKKVTKRLPTTPEREAAEKPIRRSKRISNEHEPSEPQRASPHKPAHSKSHANHERSPSAEKAKPVTVEKKRKRGANGGEEEQKIMRIALPFQDTPVIRRNKEMRKSSAESHRRSSSAMRGRRASSLIDEGRGNALPHAEVSASEFFKHISADLTEPRRMRCLLGWCGTRALPTKPEAPKKNTPEANLEFQALQAARVIQEELSLDLTTKGGLSDWFSRDEGAPPPVPLKKKSNPRNVTNAAKADELERELERLKKERAEWDELMKSAVPSSSPVREGAEAEGDMSPPHSDLLDTPQRKILEQLQVPAADFPTEPEAIQQRLRNVTENLEFSVDQFAHGMHALSTTRDTAERLADKTLADAADVLDEREKERRSGGKSVDAFDALKALGKVMNAPKR